jgi:D-alanyl-D-alanine carboxypeptidase
MMSPGKMEDVLRRGMLAALIAGISLAMLGGAAASAAADSAGPACPRGLVRVAGSCIGEAAVARKISAIAHQKAAAIGVKAAIVEVDSGPRPLARLALGQSMAGVPASTGMHFRIGAIAIPSLITLILQLEDERRLSFDDPLSRYLPGFPNAGRVTLRMLADDTSGYPDWIQGNPGFEEELFAEPFKQWTVAELLGRAFDRPLACEPGTCFHYAHTNYAILSMVVAKVTGRAVGGLIQERVLGPLGLRQTRISRRPAMPGPVLHSYNGESGRYQDSTFWSPSWTIGAGTAMSGTIGDVAREARAVGTGELISPHASRERFAPATVGLPGVRPDRYFGLGIAVVNGWELQNPVLNGYTGIMAYLPSRQLSIAIVTTQKKRSASSGDNYAAEIFAGLTAYLTPAHSGSLSG